MKKTWRANFLVLLFCSSISCFGQPSPEGEKYFNIARDYLQKNDYQKAIDNFSLSLNYIPSGENIYYLRGHARHKLGNYSTAIADFNMAINLNKNVAAFYNARAWTNCFTGEYVKAAQDGEKAILLEKNGEFYDTKATAYGMRLLFIVAISDFNEAIRLNPKALYYYKRGLMKKANNDFVGSEQDFSQARKLDPTESFKKEKDPFFTFFTEQYFAKKNKTPATSPAYKKTFIYPVKKDQSSILFPMLAKEVNSSSASGSKSYTAICTIGPEMYVYNYSILSFDTYEKLKNSDLLKNYRESMAKAANAIISNVQSFVYNNRYSGVSYQYKKPGSYGYCLYKEIRADNKIYSIHLNNDTRWPTNEEMDAFFNGFKLTY